MKTIKSSRDPPRWFPHRRAEPTPPAPPPPQRDYAAEQQQTAAAALRQKAETYGPAVHYLQFDLTTPKCTQNRGHLLPCRETLTAPQDLATALHAATHPDDRAPLADLLADKTLQKRCLYGQIGAEQELRLGEDGRYRWLRLELVLHRPDDHWLANLLFTDITDEKHRALLLQTQRRADPLTGLLTAQAFHSTVAALLAQSAPGHCHALLLVGLEGDPAVEAAFGRAMADRLLLEFANRLRTLLPDDALAGRISRDCMAVCLPDTTEQTATDTAAALRTSLKQKLDVDTALSVNVGLAYYPHGGESYNALLRTAEQNLLQTAAAPPAEPPPMPPLPLEVTARANALDRDYLTGTYNLDGFLQAVAALLAQNPDTTYAMIQLDVERFKVINELFQKQEGDRLLRLIADELTAFVADDGLCGRMWGDDFAALLPWPADRSPELQALAQSIRLKFGKRYALHIAFGVYVLDDRKLPLSAVLDRAGLAKKTIKRQQLKTIGFYDDALRRELLSEQEILDDAREALEENQFEMWLQPQYDAQADRVMGAEALVRWRHPTKGLIPPGRFIPLFERNGMISRVDLAIWTKACKCLARWRSMGRTGLTISVNISRQDVYQMDLYDVLTRLLQQYDIPPADLRLEITESTYMEDPQQFAALVSRLQAAGFVLEMDDFGSGYSSLNTLRNVPVDIIKLDMAFLADNDGTGRTGSILKHTISMAKDLNMEVIAEGVETQTQAEHLMQYGCNLFQGYYYAKPMPVSDFETLADTYNVGTAEGRNKPNSAKQ